MHLLRVMKNRFTTHAIEFPVLHFLMPLPFAQNIYCMYPGGYHKNPSALASVLKPLKTLLMWSVADAFIHQGAPLPSQQILIPQPGFQGPSLPRMFLSPSSPLQPPGTSQIKG